MTRDTRDLLTEMVERMRALLISETASMGEGPALARLKIRAEAVWGDDAAMVARVKGSNNNG